MSLVDVNPSVFVVNPRLVTGVLNVEAFDNLSVKRTRVLCYAERCETLFENPLE